MKTKRKVIRNFLYKGKRKRVEDGPIKSPIASEQEASFMFHIDDVRFSVWLLCLTLRYGEHLSKSFDVDWCDAEDQSGTPLESLIKVSHLPAVTIDGIESNSSNNQDEISSNLYTITVYISEKKFLIQGNCRYHWVEREFTEILKVVDEYLSQSDSRNSTLVSCYNPVFQAELELDILDSIDNIQEDEVSNFDDCVIDKNFSKVTAEQEKPKPTRKKTVKKSTSTPLKRLTKRQRTKPSLANPNKRNGKPNNSDLELSVLNQKIGNIESILERLDLKVAEVNAVTIHGIESNSSNNQDEISSNLYTITVYKSKKKFMIQGNCHYHWVEREFTEILEVVDEYLSQSDSRNSTLVSYNPVFQAELELDILDSIDDIQEDEVSNFDDCVIDKTFSKVTAEQEKPKPTGKKTVKKSTSTTV